MPKNIEDIIVPEKKRSIRDIPIPEGRRKVSNFTTPSASVDMEPPEQKEYRGPSAHDIAPPQRDGFNLDLEERTFSRIPRKGKWFAVGAILLILIFVTLSIFDGATLAYEPK